ncbi:hypothetical protein MNB_SV-8-1120 [hydrothermal vent metagenome]|uniref:Uncharacterized protein n=1 Tax=hydrothermal vent metagenome TaxID=652676 RepID=A0A1W1C4F7_9ZZZZ
MNITDRLDEFSAYCNNQLESIEQLSAPNHETLFRKKLYISFLESLAKAAFPAEGVKKRFIKFLDEFTDWKEWNHCCPVHLCKDSSLEKHIKEILDSDWYVDIEKVSINDENCKYTYASLLYDVRNNIVHQFQASTEWEASMQRHKIESPFYEVVVTKVFDENSKNLRDDKKHIELVFPNTFLKKLSEDGLENFIGYCRTEQINPFPGYYAERIVHEEKL